MGLYSIHYKPLLNNKKKKLQRSAYVSEVCYFALLVRYVHTLMCLIEGQGLINWRDGIFSKFNKRAGSNKEAGWNIFSNLIRGQERFVPYKRAGWKFNK